MTSRHIAPQDCPYADRHGNQLGYCPKCRWSKPLDGEAELTTLILGKTATAAARAILAAGYVKSTL